MDFKSTYWHALDRESQNSMLIPPDQLGIPTPPMKDNLESLKSRIRLGAKNVELGFTGRGKGSMGQGQTTPGMYGLDERKAMKELAKINKVNLSVHAAMQVSGYAGLGKEGFDESARQSNINEIRRTIDFAGDTMDNGGAIVVHTGEFQRSAVDLPEAERKLFQFYPEEEKEANIYLVDKQTGKVIGGLKRNQVIRRPKRDAQGRVIVEYDPKTKLAGAEMEKWSYDMFVKQAEENKKLGDNLKDERETDPSFLMFKAQLEDKQDEAHGWATKYSHDYSTTKQEVEKLERLKRDMETNPEATVQKMMQIWELENRNEAIVDISKSLSKLSDLKHSMEYARGTATGKSAEVAQIQMQIDNAVPLAEYGKKRTHTSFAELAVDAMKTTKERGLTAPLFISPENVFAEQYGAHPDELKDIIIKSRDKFVELLTKEKVKQPSGDEIDNPHFDPKVSKKEAKKLSEDHIRATFDIGHAHTWKKHFKGDDKEYHKWIMGKVDDLNKANVIGHVHMSDNFGFEDEHTTLGQGTAPIKEFVKDMKRAGFKGTMIAEPAHNDYKALFGAWRELESPVYRVDHVTHTFADVENSYFGRTFSPSYTFGGYLPVGGEGEKLTWAAVPLE